MTVLEILQKGLLTTVLGMGTVFVVLIFISFIISLFKYIPMLEEKFSKKSNESIEPVEAEETVLLEVQEEEVDDLELIAVITAAITAHLEKETPVPVNGLVVRSIKRVNKSKWQNA